MKGEGSATKHALRSSAADPAALPYLLRASEVAVLLRTTTRAIYALTERGQLPGAVRVGRRLLFRRDDLLELLRKSCPLPEDR